MADAIAPIISAIIASAVGMWFVAFPASVLKLIAVMHRRMYAADQSYTWFTKVFDWTPFGRIQRRATGMDSAELMEKLHEDPGAAPALTLYVRAFGVIAILFALFFIFAATTIAMR